MTPKKKPAAVRFWPFVAQGAANDCWEWQSTRNNSGYGKFWRDGRTDLAHRVSYELNVGPIPPGLYVRHSCDNPPCVNPAHLSVGTPKQNSADSIAHDRHPQGERNPRARLTEAQVVEIRQQWARGETAVSLASIYGVASTTVDAVVTGKTWAHLLDREAS